MVYGEAMVCKAPIFTTENISSAEMVPSEFGLICENSEQGLRSGFNKLLSDRNLIKEYKQNLESFDYTNNRSVDKIKELIAK